VTAPAQVMIADDHAVVREGLKVLIDREPDLHVVAQATDGLEAVARAREGNIDLVVLDIAMPRMTGLQATREITATSNIPVLLLSMYDRDQYFFEALAAGAAGYVLKRQADRDIIAACRAALRGEPFIYPRAMAALMRRHLEGTTGADTVLTARENTIVKLIAEGHSTQEIAQVLTISPKTVERHRANILQKLEMRDRTEVTRYAIRTGLIEP
jgi:DNA-binding NarL/FixJ family response regulator